ncbi:integrin alpha-9 [Parasteatoda tepidariorum]|uniref:integrin alpha-9 n=1 Tax=Parasteatoda tepidariorum TaxID=114398 RepID=UPI00077FD93D|nr:integrin alpha-9 [Parasteatoda tepidariorum]
MNTRITIVWALAHLFSTALSYNIDTKFPIIFKGSPDSYFGYTVALHRNRNGPMAIIGSPRSNSTVLGDQLYQPGALFKCDLRASCEEITLDKKGNTQTDNGNNVAYYDKKDSMWLGVSLDILHSPTRSDIVTCGHLWKNQFYRQHYLANGACYVINSDLDSRSVTKLVPFVEKAKQAIIPPGIYYYAFGQVGTSVAFSEDGSFLHLGAPGFYDWTGTAVSYALNPDSVNQNYVRPSIPDPPVDQNLTPESYIGYSVTSGKFYDNHENYVAVGAPRDGEFCGRVYIYKAMKTSNKRMVVHHRKTGFQLGEYFGAAVLGINLNGDEYDDLLVGAPLHSMDNGVDEGKVYVFISNGLGLQNYAELYGKNRAYGRFGTALANLGDINQDGYNDIAIGAPYEDEKGAVYIYHGSASGMNIEYVQRIAAKDIDLSLSGFGIHISRGFDIDSNQYPDLLVGSYASSNAVLFRSQPVIQLSAKIVFTPKQINTNVTNCTFQGQKVSCISVKACLTYFGKHAPLSLDFTHELYLEHPVQGNFISNRGFLYKNGNSYSVLKHNSSLAIAGEKCFTEEVYIRNGTKDLITPIQLLYKYSLVSEEENRAFNNNFPVIDPQSSTNLTSFISFLTGCGNDDMCNSDLAINVNVVGMVENTPLTIGKNSTLSLSIEVVNHGEPAYLAELLITLPPELPSINQDFCFAPEDSFNHKNNATLICDLTQGKNFLSQGKKEKLTIKLDLTKIPTDTEQVLIFLEARTVSNEINPQDNNYTLPLNFTTVAAISITGTPTHEQIPYDEKIQESFLPLTITHTYFIMNHGPSPVQIVDFILYVPTSFHKENREETFVTFTSLEADNGKALTIPAKCNDSNIVIKPLSPEINKNNRDGIFDEDNLLVPEEQNKTDTVIEALSEFGTTDKTSTRLKRSTAAKATPQRKSEIVLSCETINCIAIVCSASPFTDTRKFARITVSVLVNISIINDNFDPWYKIQYITSGEASIRKTGNNSVSKQHRTEVQTTIVNSGPRAHEKIAQWIIFVSIGIGILLLLIILILLIKFGFFKRTKKEEMEKMKTKEDLKDYDHLDEESEALN